MAKKASFEVRFRGESEKSLQAWKPVPGVHFECEEGEAERRFDVLVSKGLNAIEVDGVIPYVVEVVEISYPVKNGQECRIPTPRYWRYAEEGCELMGVWAAAKAA